MAAGGGGGGVWFVIAGGGVGFFGACGVLGGALLGVLDGELLFGVELSVGLGGVLEVDLIQVDSGVLLSGSSSATPWIARGSSNCRSIVWRGCSEP